MPRSLYFHVELRERFTMAFPAQITSIFFFLVFFFLFLFSTIILSYGGQSHLARHSERGKKTRETEEEVGRYYQAMDSPGVPQVPEGSGKQGKMEETGCEIICGAPTTLAVKG